MKNKGQGSVVLPSRREYSEAFKRKVVSEVGSGELTREAARRKYGIAGGSTVQTWCLKYGMFERLGVKVTVRSSKELNETKDLRERVRQLEKALADEKLKTMALETLIEVAERDLKVPIRKKSGAKQ
jgi:transposase